MQEYQAVVRVRHQGINLAERAELLDAVTGKLVEYAATGEFWDNVSQFTMTVRVPTLWDVAGLAGRTVRSAFDLPGVAPVVVRVDAWNVEEWDAENGVGDE